MLPEGDDAAQAAAAADGGKRGGKDVRLVGFATDCDSGVLPSREYPRLSPLTIAVFARRNSVIPVLIRYGADATKHDASLLSPYERALLQVRVVQRESASPLSLSLSLSLLSLSLSLSLSFPVR
jgi:hypothetical protein